MLVLFNVLRVIVVCSIFAWYWLVYVFLNVRWRALPDKYHNDTELLQVCVRNNIELYNEIVTPALFLGFIVLMEPLVRWALSKSD